MNEYNDYLEKYYNGNEILFSIYSINIYFTSWLSDYSVRDTVG